VDDILTNEAILALLVIWDSVGLVIERIDDVQIRGENIERRWGLEVCNK
jgi:hypothetical protein